MPFRRHFAAPISTESGALPPFLPEGGLEGLGHRGAEAPARATRYGPTVIGSWSMAPITFRVPGWVSAAMKV